MRSVLYILIIPLLAIATGCGGSADTPDRETRLIERAELSEILRPDPKRPSIYEERLDSMPDGGVKMKINYLGATLGKTFNDSNYLQLQAAAEIGFRNLSSPADAWHPGREVVRIATNSNYFVDKLTHSLPFLVPEAAELLDDIGHAFRDSLASRGGGAYRIKVTSVLRTPATVKALRRRNGNAVETSTHLFGTTFDISYAQFVCDNDSLPRTQEDLKNLLGEVMNDLRTAGRCYVKYERKQACFHITARRHKNI